MPHVSGFHSRGYLPHLKSEGRAYFVTFRLADSLPRELIGRLREQRDGLLRQATAEMRKPTAEERGNLHAWYAAEVDSLLDRSTGQAWLKQPAIAAIVTNTLGHFEQKRYQLHAWVVMPNHVHAIVRPFAKHTLEQILHSWKSYSAQSSNKMLGRVGQPFWQRESYDHLVRDEAELAACCRYVEENPIKAGLCRTSDEWPWSSARPT